MNENQPTDYKNFLEKSCLQDLFMDKHIHFNFNKQLGTFQKVEQLHNHYKSLQVHLNKLVTFYSSEATLKLLMSVRISG